MIIHPEKVITDTTLEHISPYESICKNDSNFQKLSNNSSPVDTSNGLQTQCQTLQNFSGTNTSSVLPSSPNNKNKNNVEPSLSSPLGKEQNPIYLNACEVQNTNSYQYPALNQTIIDISNISPDIIMQESPCLMLSSNENEYQVVFSFPNQNPSVKDDSILHISSNNANAVTDTSTKIIEIFDMYHGYGDLFSSIWPLLLQTGWKRNVIPLFGTIIYVPYWAFISDRQKGKGMRPKYNVYGLKENVDYYVDKDCVLIHVYKYGNQRYEGDMNEYKLDVESVIQNSIIKGTKVEYLNFSSFVVDQNQRRYDSKPFVSPHHLKQNCDTSTGELVMDTSDITSYRNSNIKKSRTSIRKLENDLNLSLDESHYNRTKKVCITNLLQY